MSDRTLLIKEINQLPDFIVEQLLAIVHYIKLGIENEYIPETGNEFYRSEPFKKIVSQSVAEYHTGQTAAMDILPWW